MTISNLPPTRQIKEYWGPFHKSVSGKLLTANDGSLDHNVILDFVQLQTQAPTKDESDKLAKNLLKHVQTKAEEYLRRIREQIESQQLSRTAAEKSTVPPPFKKKPEAPVKAVVQDEIVTVKPSNKRPAPTSSLPPEMIKEILSNINEPVKRTEQRSREPIRINAYDGILPPARTNPNSSIPPETIK